MRELVAEKKDPGNEQTVAKDGARTVDRRTELTQAHEALATARIILALLRSARPARGTKAERHAHRAARIAPFKCSVLYPILLSMRVVLYALSVRQSTMGIALNVEAELKNILGESLSLGERAARFTDATLLLGSLPELDSMAVVTLITSIEERFGIVIGDDEISAQTFETFGSLRDFVAQKLDA